MLMISVTRRAIGPFSITGNRLAYAYIHQKSTTPNGELFVSSTFPDNFDDPEFIAERGKEKTRKSTEEAAGSIDAAAKAARDNSKPVSQSSASKKSQIPASEAEQEPRLDDM
jgi:hypothetical protein